MLLGALVANLPDVDTVAGLFVSGDKSLLIHRGITHSLFVALLFGLGLALCAKRIKPDIRFALFAFLFCFELFLHDLLDTCTSYGTGLLEPFIQTRFSIHLIYVADPLFTISLLIASIYLLWGQKHRAVWAITALIIAGLYLCFAGINKVKVDSASKATLTTPAPFNIFLWYCIVKTNKGYYTGYASVFDQQPVNYTYYPKNDSLLIREEPLLKTFADGYYTISRSQGALYFNVLRFEQIQGWRIKNAPFALSYPIKRVGDENMIIQKGRLKGWNKHTLKQYLERIAGNQNTQ